MIKMGKVYLYDINKNLYTTNDHYSDLFKNKEVVEVHKNAFNGLAYGTEILIPGEYKSDDLDHALIALNSKYWLNRGIKNRPDLKNCNVFQSLGISYRLIEIDFIDNKNDEAIYDKYFEAYCQGLAKIFKDCPKDVVLVAGHGEGDPGAIGISGRREADMVRSVVNRVYQITTSSPIPTPVITKKEIGYKAHTQGVGWGPEVFDGSYAGVTGKSLRMEAFMITQIVGSVVEFVKVHIQNQGWKTYKQPSKNTVFGTTGLSLALEDIAIKLEGFEFGVHQAGTGNTSWTDCDGVSTLGSTGQKIRLEAIRIRRKK